MGAWYAAWLWRIKGERHNPQKARLLACGAAAGSVLIFVLINRMFSDQFIVWILGLAPFAVIALPPGGPARERLLIMAGFMLAACNSLFFVFGGVEFYPVVARGLYWASYAWFLLLLFGLVAPAKRPWALWTVLLLSLAGLALISLALHTGLNQLALLAGVLAAALLCWLLLARRWQTRIAGAVLICASILVAALHLGSAGPYQRIGAQDPKLLPNQMLACCSYAPLPSGRLEVSYHFSLTRQAEKGKPLMLLDVVTDSGRNRLAQKKVLATGQEVLGRPLTVSLGLENQDPRRDMEIRAQDLSAGAVEFLGYEVDVSPMPGGLFINGWDWFGFAASNWYDAMIGFLVFMLGLAMMRLVLHPRLSGNGG